MKVLEGQGNYLQEKARINKKRAILFFIIGLGFLLASYTISTLGLLIYAFFVSLSISSIFLKNYENYSKGLEAETAVAEYLQILDDRYYLINDIKLPNSYGNIDHIVLGPNGIFVIETKNFGGCIRCDGDSWYQHKPEWKTKNEIELKSPSKQVKGNSVRLKNFIESGKIFPSATSLWVEGIVVFTNIDMELHLNSPTVPTMKIDELSHYILNKQSRTKFSAQELESIGKLILTASGRIE
ncbi:MAG: nuclease-related domain-containing protein [Candidatus Aenigmatarchaeota archaeon]